MTQEPLQQIFQPELAKNQVLKQFAGAGAELAQTCDSLILAAFNQSFPKSIQEQLGLVVVAGGSYGRKQQIKHISDAEIQIIWTKADPDLQGQAVIDTYETALAQFHIKAKDALLPIGIECELRFVTSHFTDLQRDLENYQLSTSREYQSKQKEKLNNFLINLTNLLFGRALNDPLNTVPQKIIKDLVQDETRLNHISEAIIRGISMHFGPYGTLATADLQIKNQLQRTAHLAVSLIECLKIAAVPVPVELEKLEQTFRKHQLEFTFFRHIHQQADRPRLTHTHYTPENFLFSDRLDLQRNFENKYPQAKNLDVLTWLYSEVEILDYNLKRLVSWASEGVPLTPSPLKKSLAKDPFENLGNVATSLREYLANDPDYLPALQRLRGLVDPNSYQTFTHYEHALRSTGAIDQLYRGEKRDERFTKLLLSLSPKNIKVLYIATALHDCAKYEEIKLGIQDSYWHAERGAMIALEELNNLGLTIEDAGVIARLIANHLWLKDVSKYSLHTIHQAISTLPLEIRNETFLTQLSLLTYADGLSTNPKSWDIFRSNHLYDATLSAFRQIKGEPTILPLSDFTEHLFDYYEVYLFGQNQQQISELLKLLPDSFRSLPILSVCNFINIFNRFDNSPEIHFAIHNLPSDLEEQSFKADLLLVANDRNYLASNIVAEITTRGFNIQSADFYTSSTGVVFNRLTLHHHSDRQDDLPRLREALKTMLQNGELQIPKIDPNFQLDPNSTEVSLVNPQFPPSDRTFMIKIKTEDRKGLLLRILQGFNSNQLALRSCCINSEGNKVENFFELSFNSRANASELSSAHLELLKTALEKELLGS